MGALGRLVKLKEELGIAVNDASKDEWLKRLLMVSSGFVKGYCHRDFELQERTESHSALPESKKIILREYPVASISSLQVDGGTVPAEDYRWTGEGILYFPAGFPEGFHHIRVVYTAGYATTGWDADPPTGFSIPEDLEEATLHIAILFYKEADAGGEGRLGVLEKEWANVGRVEYFHDLPPRIQSILQAYRSLV